MVKFDKKTQKRIRREKAKRREREAAALMRHRRVRGILGLAPPIVQAPATEAATQADAGVVAFNAAALAASQLKGNAHGSQGSAETAQGHDEAQPTSTGGTVAG